jgi:hypothetical protein
MHSVNYENVEAYRFVVCRDLKAITGLIVQAVSHPADQTLNVELR